MELKHLLLFLLTFFFQPAKAQNLVLNPSFEDFEKGYIDTLCPFPLHTITKGWFGYNTADYYNTTFEEKGILGSYEANSGTACVGICFIKDANAVNYREYIVANFSEPLEEGKKYKFGMFYKYQAGGLASDGLGVYFTSDLSLPPRGLFGYHPQINNFADSILFDKNGWGNITEDYTANGGEKYLVIGNFKPDNKLLAKRIEPNNGFRHNSYYLIDDVSLTPYEEEVKDTIPVTQTEVYEPKKKYVLKFVYFDTDKAILLPKSYVELDKLVTFLKEKSDTKIEIGGHTDNAGTYDHNIILSSQRAEAVVTYLISQGIISTRLTYKGYGPNQPIAPNDTPDNMQLNRRVDFMIVE
jgi:OOP family OmpA-OmpF porin